MNDRSARPSLTASSVCGAPTTAFGSRLHFTRPAVACSMSLQSGMVTSATSRWDGGTQAFTFRTVCEFAVAAGNAKVQASTPTASVVDLMRFLPFLVRCRDPRGVPRTAVADPCDIRHWHFVYHAREAPAT